MLVEICPRCTLTQTTLRTTCHRKLGAEHHHSRLVAFTNYSQIVLFENHTFCKCTNVPESASHGVPFVVKITKISVFVNVFYLLFSHEPNLHCERKTKKCALDVRQNIAFVDAIIQTSKKVEKAKEFDPFSSSGEVRPVTFTCSKIK